MIPLLRRPATPLALVVASTFACNPQAPPAEQPDELPHYPPANRAEVRGTVGPLRSDDWPGEAWGLRLRVAELVHLPSRLAGKA